MNGNRKENEGEEKWMPSNINPNGKDGRNVKP